MEKKREDSSSWERMIATKTYGLIDPDPYVVESVGILQQLGIKKILDLGCGQGRHTWFLSQERFEVSALDISSSAVAATQNILKEKMKSAEVVTGAMEALPFPDGYFDAVLAWRALYLGYIENIKRAFAEVKRVLRPGGILYASIRSTQNTLYHIGKIKGKQVEHNTFLFNDDGLRGIVYHFFTKEEVLLYLSDMEIKEIGELELQHTGYTARYPEYENRFWVILAKKQNGKT